MNSKMKVKWEYCIIEEDGTFSSISDLLNSLGDDGWELIEMLKVYKHQDTFNAILVFKRLCE